MTSPKPSTERLAYRPAEVAYLLGVTPRAVYEWIREGRLRARRLGPRFRLVTAKDLEKFLQGEEANK
ncbi:MAG: helix-turn-helix domain-containing protein [Candidatus Methylacidiphilaceae bacterium]